MLVIHANFPEAVKSTSGKLARLCHSKQLRLYVNCQGAVLPKAGGGKRENNQCVCLKRLSPGQQSVSSFADLGGYNLAPRSGHD